MRAQYTSEDFKNPRKNPYYHKLIAEITVPVRRQDLTVFEEVAKANNETVEMVMKRCLKMAAEDIRNHD